MKKVTALILAVLMSVTCAVYVQAATTNSYDVTVYFTGREGLALKYSPNINAGKYFNIPEGTSLHIENVSSGWGQTSWNGCNGWVALQYTKIVGDYPTPQPSSGYISPVYYTVYNTEGEGLELRTSPTTQASTFGPMYDGTVIKAEARSGEWVYGRSNGHYGWCNTTYLRGSSAGEISTYEAQNTQQQPTTPQQPTSPQTTAQLPPQTPAAPQSVQDPTQQTQPAAQPVPQPAPATDNSYIQAYIDVLNSNRDAINLYDWQHEDGISKSVVLNDFIEGGSPELVFISAVEEQQEGVTRYIPQIHIYTAQDGAAKELFSDTWGKARYAGGYFYYYLFRMAGKPSLYYYTEIGDDGGTISYGRFDAAEDGTLGMTDLFVDRDFGSPSDNRHEYYKMGTAIEEEEYQMQTQHAQEVTESILMYSDGCGDFVDGFLAEHECPAMTLDTALGYLNGMAAAVN